MLWDLDSTPPSPSQSESTKVAVGRSNQPDCANLTVFSRGALILTVTDLHSVHLA